MNRRSFAFPLLLVSLVAASVIACGDDDDDNDVINPPGADGGTDAQVPGAPVIAAATLPSIVGAEPAAPVTFTATGDAPITWAITGAAAGMVIDAATGVYSGTPTAGGEFTITVTATNARGSATATLTQSVTSPASDAWVLLDGNRIAPFATTFPGGAVPVTLTNVADGDVLVSIDRRPGNGYLYGLAVNQTAQTIRVYSTIATPVGPGIAQASTADTTWGIDFNPTVDRLRVVSNKGANLRLDPNSGALAATDTAFTGTDTGASAVAYTNSIANTAATTLYTIGATTKSLYIQNPPNAGTLTSAVAIGPDYQAILGFDIAETVSVTANNAAVTEGLGHVNLRLAGSTTDTFASLNLVSGQLGVIGNFPFAGTHGFSLSKAAARPVVGLTSAGGIVRFLDATPATVSNATATPTLNANEVLVGIDFRPATGQLYGLGINATLNTGTLYRIDPQTGAAAQVGTVPGSIAFVGTDFPDAATGYGVDFNPSVDRIRVTTSTGLNFRINPETGAPVDADANTAGTQPDGALNGPATSLDGVAYTNGPSAMGATSEYGLNAATNSLHLVTNPNAGTLGPAIPVTLGGAALDFTAVNGFDIPSTVTAPAANTAVTAGVAYASLVVGGATNLYQIDLVTGAATLLGAIGSATVSLSGLAVGR